MMTRYITDVSDAPVMYMAHMWADCCYWLHAIRMYIIPRNICILFWLTMTVAATRIPLADTGSHQNKGAAKGAANVAKHKAAVNQPSGQQAAGSRHPVHSTALQHRVAAAELEMNGWCRCCRGTVVVCHVIKYSDCVL